MRLTRTQFGTLLLIITSNVVAFFSTNQTGHAGDFRVFTTIHDLSRGDDSAPLVARTITLFHAGKVYDYIESDASSEVIVFEPTQRRFQILNLTRGLVTTAAFDEIKQKLSMAREETAKEARIMGSKPQSAEFAEMLAFQLSPSFKSSFDQNQQRLDLLGPPLSYNVETISPEDPQVVDLYLDYTDWVCQLNYVLTIGPILPEPRLALNRELKELKRLPASVALQARTSPPIHMRAEHQFHLDLNEKERNWIHQWETQLSSKTIRHVTLQEYQQELLTAKTQ